MQAMTEITIEELAGQAYDAFERVERGDKTITTLKEEHRNDHDWIYELVQSAHGDFFPDDWRYDAIRSALGEIHDAGGNLDDLGSEWADNYVDTYTGARLEWLASNLNRPGYCDEAVEEGLVEPEADIVQRIGIGQYMEAREVWGLVTSALEEELESRETDD